VLHLVQSILPNFFLRKTKIFSVFLLLRLALSKHKKILSYATNTQALQRKLGKQRNQSLVGIGSWSGI
jgi:hypothetical protein